MGKEDYHVMGLVGEGSFGKVYKGRRKSTRQTVAMNVILKLGKTDKDLHNLRQEIEILGKLKHENITEMIDAFETPQEFYVVTKFAQGGNNVYVGKPPFFDGNNYDYWKIRMMAHLKAMGKKIWRIVNEGFTILDEKNKTYADEENELLNDQAINVLYGALDISEFNRVKNLKTAYEIWNKLMEIHEGTSTVKEVKLYVYKGKFNEFTMKKDEDVSSMFNRLNDIVNEFKGLGFDVANHDFSYKFLRCLPAKYETIVTWLVRANLKTMTPTQVLGEVLTYDIFKQSQMETHGLANEEENKSIALMVQSSKEKNNDENNNDEDSAEEIALLVRRLKRTLKNKSYKKHQSSKKNSFEDKKCFDCGEVGHIAVSCPNKKKKNKKSDDRKMRKFYKKKKGGQTYYVEWDSDASSDSDDDDDEKSSKGIAGSTIKEAPSLFSSPFCLMAKGEA